jgi:hypothetical protein
MLQDDPGMLRLHFGIQFLAGLLKGGLIHLLLRLELFGVQVLPEAGWNLNKGVAGTRGKVLGCLRVVSRGNNHAVVSHWF